MEIIRTNSQSESLNLSTISNLSNSVPWLASNNCCLKIACANARSVVQKINSLITLFEELELHIALLTETWLTAKVCSVKTMNDLTDGANINFIRRDRGSREAVLLSATIRRRYVLLHLILSEI